MHFVFFLGYSLGQRCDLHHWKIVQMYICDFLGLRCHKLIELDLVHCNPGISHLHLALEDPNLSSIDMLNCPRNRSCFTRLQRPIKSIVFAHISHDCTKC